MPKTVDVLGNLVTAGIPLGIHYCVRNRELKQKPKRWIAKSRG
jgi:hypothetical protein